MRWEKINTTVGIVTAVAAVVAIPVVLYTSEIRFFLSWCLKKAATETTLPAWLWIVACLFIWMANLVMTYLLERFWKTSNQESPTLLLGSNDVLLLELRFDYLPSLPWQVGWTWAYGNSSPPRLLPACSPTQNVSGGIVITTALEYGLDYSLPAEIQETCKLLKFSGKFNAESDTMFFTQVEMINGDNSMHKTKWIKHYKGNKPVTKESEGEWVRWMDGRDLGGNWSEFMISISDAVRETWGREGWQYKSLKKIRIRGNISISPIELYGNES